MKKLLSFLAIALLLTTFTSCNTPESSEEGTRMDSVKATTHVIGSLKKNISPNWKITHVMWSEDDSLSNQLHTLDVQMINRVNNHFARRFYVGGKHAGTGERRKRVSTINPTQPQFDSIRGISPNSIDAALLQKQFEAAKKMIPRGYKFHSIASCTISEVLPTGISAIDAIRPAPGTIETSFVLRLTGKSRRALPERELTARVLPDGSVRLDE